MPPRSRIDPLAISDILVYHRHRNAHVIGLTVAALNVALVVFLAAALSPPVGVLLAIAGVAIASALGAALVWRSRMQLGALIILVAQLIGHVAAVGALHNIADLPLFACVPVLIAAATLGSAHVGRISALALATIGIETWVATDAGIPWKAMASPVIGGISLLAAVAVISYLHVRETEKAVAIAEERDRLRKLAVEDARASEERYRLIADNTDDLISLIDEEGHAHYLSPSHQRCSGIDWNTWAPDALAQVVHPDDLQETLAALGRARQDGHATVLMRLVTADEKYRTFESHFSRVMRESREFVAIISRDVTERHALEVELRKVQRMEALGRLAGGVAHDFNNLLGVIAGAADLAQQALPKNSAAREDFQIIHDAVERATDLTGQLLAFSRKQVVASQALDPAATLGALTDIIQRLVGPSIGVELLLEPDCPRVNIPKSQLEQIVMNLATNARDAMPRGGRLRIVIAHREIRSTELPGLTSGSYLEIAATDTGTGIAPEILPHLFEPFFTTKAESRGTGLGLATCYGIATQRGGTILVETELGTGSTFRALLPASDAPPTHVTPTPKPVAVSSHAQRVLVVDDDPELVRVAARILSSAGLQVTEAATLAQAERFLQDMTAQFDIVLTDIVLGQDRGTVVAQLALELRPGIRVVMMSGYAPDPETTSGILGKRASFLPKPFDRQALLNALGVA